MKLERILLMNFCLVASMQLAIDETKDIDNTQTASFFLTLFYNITIAWNSTRIGVISFNDNSTTTLYSLSNEKQSFSEIENVLSNLPSSDDVSSEPSLAINAAIDEFSNGRKNIPQIMLLVAGATGNEEDLKAASSNLKNANVTLMIYDMSGGFFNPDIASPNCTFRNYSQDSAQQAFCTIKYSYCGVTTGKFDIILGIDGSEAMSKNFDDVKSSLLTLFYPFTISQTTNRVAVFTYDDKTTNNVSTLTTVMDYQGLITLISNLPEPNATDSSPNLAMAVAHDMFYLEARPDAKQVFLMVAASLGADYDNFDRVCAAENDLVNSNITTLLIDASIFTLPPCLSPMYHTYITVNLTNQVIDDICTKTASQINGNPLSDEIGTACANDPSNLWLDIIVAIDNTTSMGAGVNNIAATLSTVFYDLNIAQNGAYHYTRVGIIIFDSVATIYANLTTYSSNDELESGLAPLYSTPPGTVETIDIYNALKKAYDMFTDPSPGNQRNARKVVLLFASTYNPNEAKRAIELSQNMKLMNYFIIGVDYNDPNGVATDLLKKIASPGMVFYASDGQGQSGKEPLFNELLDAFSYANCMCPSRTIQFIAINETTENAKYYADCFQGEMAGSFAKFAELGCESIKGTLVSLTSQEKENFIYQNARLLTGGTSHFHIGLTSMNGNLNWYNYNKTQIPLGNYTNWASGPGTGDYCVYSENLGLNKWGWLTEACIGANPFNYICQIHACDADDDCEIDQLYQREQKQN